jgi:hypothetical protein
VLLFHHKTDGIKISVEAYFKDDNLIIDGYDIGKRVEEYWGDSDYEYITTVTADQLTKLYAVLGVEADDKEKLLTMLSQRFNTNSCYTDVRNFFDQHDIRYESSSWN